MSYEALPLFQLGDFTLHSGDASTFRIDCDALTDEDWRCLAWLAVQRLPPFGAVYGIPQGGVRFANALREHKTTGPTLIADDVLTTGASMEQVRATFSDDAPGVVAFARGCCPSWVVPVFVLGGDFCASGGAEKGTKP